MSESKPILQIDDDWKRQAQAEKQRLAEQAQAKVENPTAKPASTEARARREMPPASFETLVNLVATQALYYLGALAGPDEEPQVSLEMARHHIDLLGVLESKTAGNLTDDEKRMLDVTLYDLRMRFVQTARQVIR